MYFYTLKECEDQLGEINEIFEPLYFNNIFKEDCKNIFIINNEEQKKIGFIYLKKNSGKFYFDILNFSILDDFKDRGYEEEILNFISNFSQFNECNEIRAVIFSKEKTLLNYFFKNGFRVFCKKNKKIILQKK